MHVNHIRRGSGEPLVLIHGIGHRWQAWLPVLDKLAASHEVIALDLPGFGGSPVPPGGMPPDMPATVAMFREFLTASGLDRPHAAGYSLGGAITLELAAAGLARSATAFSPAGFFTTADRLRALAILRLLRATTFAPETLIRRTMGVPALRALAFSPLVADPSRIGYERAVQDALALRRGSGFASVARASRTYRFAATPTVPVTIAWGEKDRILPPRQAKRAGQVLPAARHVNLPDCGHIPMSDNPDLVAGLILQTTRAVQPAGH